MRWIAAVALLVAASAHGGDRPKSERLQVVSYADGVWTAMSDSAPGELAFGWAWSDEIPPFRFSPNRPLDPKMSPDDDVRKMRLEVEPKRSAEAFRLRAAPKAMWLEVPESMLPSWPVPANGVIEVPYAQDAEWRVRVLGRDEGTWWASVTPSLASKSPLVILPATSQSFRVESADGTPLDANIAIMTILDKGNPQLAAQYISRQGIAQIESLPNRASLTLVLTEANHAAKAVPLKIGEFPAVITMSEGFSITGTVVDGKDHPLEGVEVTAEGWLSGASVIAARRGKTTEDGRWMLKNLPARSKFVLAMRREGFAPRLTEVSLGDQHMDLGPIVLVSGEQLTVRVVDDTDLRPVVGALVSAKFGRRAISNKKGLAVLDDVSVANPLDVAVEASGYLDFKKTLGAPLSREVTVEVTRAFVVTGRFIEASGEQIEGAAVRILDGGHSREERIVGGDFQVAVEPDKALRLEFVSPSTLSLLREVQGRRGEDLDLGVLHPETGNRIRGRVVTEDGMPAKGVAVWTTRPITGGPLLSWSSGNTLRTLSEDEGMFTLRGIGPQPSLLRFDLPGYARAFRSVTVDGSTGLSDIGDIRLEKGTTVRVTSNSDFTGTANISIDENTGEIDRLSAAMQDGSATIRQVPPGPVRVSLSRDRTVVCEHSVEIPRQDDIFEVECSVQDVIVSGRVLIGDRPAAGGTLVWTPAAAGALAGVIYNQSSPLGATQQRVLGGSGQVSTQVALDGTFETSEINPAIWNVRWIGAEHGTTPSKTVKVESQSQQSIMLQYDASTIRGMVVDGDSRPARFATVEEIGGPGSAVTKSDGTFAMGGLLPGNHRLRARLGDDFSDVIEVQIELGRESQPVRLELGNLNRDEIRVQVLAASGSAGSNAFVFVETDTGNMMIATTDSTGWVKMRFRDIPPRQLRYAVMHTEGWVLGTWLTSDQWLKGIMVRMGPSGALLVNSKFEGTPQILGPNGWNLTALLQRIGSWPSVKAGVPFSLSGLPPGSYQISLGTSHVQASIGAKQSTSVTLE